MGTNIQVCPNCGQIINEKTKFCSYCGHDCREPSGVDNFFGSLRSRFDEVKDKTFTQSRSARELAISQVSPDKASQAVGRMVDMVTYVAQDLKRGMSSDMVKAVVVSARISFVVFSIGVSINLDKLPMRENP